MPAELSDFTDKFVTLTPNQWIGIPIAILAAIFLALGAQFQHRGVGRVEADTAEIDTSPGLSPRQVLLLLARPSWLIGTIMLGLAIVLQLSSLYFAPIIVVQPLGAVALVVTAIVNSKVSKVKLDPKSIRAIAFCVGGVGLFVTIAAFTAKSSPISAAQLGVILALLGIITMGLSLAFAFLRDKFKAIVYILGAGLLYGFVATLAKVVIDRAKTGDFEWLTITCIVALLAAAALGGYFVQNAYASGPPDLVIAGLTVVDPLVAVSIGVVVLQEASDAPWWVAIVFIACAALAVYGVFQLAKHHPQAQR
ncbi:MAG: DMT family transporter [Cryobacterium sp.]|nr:DMT family transporter [Cryobacterium sp.]MCC7127476.1 DMT family transporter [Microbacteriaceae bacterium]